MLSIGEDDRLQASRQASVLLKVWENLLGFRISLQKAFDLGNKLPVNSGVCDLPHADFLIDIVSNLFRMLEVNDLAQGHSNSIVSWDDIMNQRSKLTSKWKNVLNKWHSRLQFGSKDALMKMKTFKNSFWDNVCTRF